MTLSARWVIITSVALNSDSSTSFGEEPGYPFSRVLLMAAG